MFETIASIIRYALVVLLVLMYVVESVVAESIPEESTLGEIKVDSLTDPTRPAGWARQSTLNTQSGRPSVRVDYIIYSTQRKLVSINGSSVLEGGHWKGVRVVKIDPGKVLLSWRGEQWLARVSGAGSTGSQRLSIRRSLP